MTTHSTKYQEYIHSEAWQKKRQRKLKEAGYKCSRCGSVQGLQVHHKTYERLGRERMRDLDVLCEACHAQADRERAAATTVKRFLKRIVNVIKPKKYRKRRVF